MREWRRLHLFYGNFLGSGRSRSVEIGMGMSMGFSLFWRRLLIMKAGFKTPIPIHSCPEPYPINLSNLIISSTYPLKNKKY